MRVALLSDWIYGGGSEQVVLQLHKLFPEAPIYTSYCSEEWRKRLDGKVVTGYLQYPPFRQLRKFLPLLRQLWFARLDLSEFDLIISVTGNGEAKFACVPNGKHICYCNTPVHYYWRHYDKYVQNPGFRPKWLARLGLKLLVKPLRKRDFAAAQKVDFFIGNSTHIQHDIKKFYKRDAVIIHPPVAISKFKATKQPVERRGYVTLGRQVPLKKIDIIIEACKAVKAPLVVIGNGPEHSRLVGITGPTIHFKTDVSDDELPNELAAAEAFIFASYEDFGIAPIEAMAAGTPVIAYQVGGALDYVTPGKTGEFFSQQSVESLVAVLEAFKPNSYHHETIQKSSVSFSVKSFRVKLQHFIEKNI